MLDVKNNPLVSYKLKYLGTKFARLRLVSYVDGYSSQAVDTVERPPAAPEQPQPRPPMQVHTGNFIGGNGASDSFTGIFTWQGTIMRRHCFVRS